MPERIADISSAVSPGSHLPLAGGGAGRDAGAGRQGQVLLPQPLPQRKMWTVGGASRILDPMARGVVKFYKAEKGWGAISCAELPAGQDVWVHCSDIEGTGYRSLDAGDIVDFDYRKARQDFFHFRATRARRFAPGPAPTLRRVGSQVITVADGTPDTPLTPKRR